MGRFQKHIFVCINERKSGDTKGCCTSRGSLKLLDHLKGRVHELGLKKKVRVNKSGCLDACSQGPTMVIYPQAIWYTYKNKFDIEDIVEQHLIHGKVIERLLLSR